MSSFNTHARNVLNKDLAIKNRWSHFRSCMNKVSNLANLNRIKIVELIKQDTSIDCERSGSEEELIIAWKYLTEYREKLIASK